MINTIKKIALILDDQESLENICSYQTDSTTVLTKNVEIYIALINFVIKDIASNFLCYKNIERLMSNACSEIELSDLEFQPCTIKAVKFWSGRNAKISVLSDRILVPSANEQYSVEYTYFPDDIDDLNSTLALPIGLDETAVCYGAIYEYYTQKMMFNEAAIWELKYKNCLKNMNKKYAGSHLFFRGF